MRKSLLFALSLCSALIMSSCTKEDDTEILTTPDGTPVSTEYVADPPGTVIVNMVYDKEQRFFVNNNPYSYSYLVLRTDNNFSGSGYNGGYNCTGINTVGMVTGLGAITKIPSGMVWADKVAAIPGYGYIVNFEGHYVTFYVADWMENGQYSGITIKYKEGWTPQ